MAHGLEWTDASSYSLAHLVKLVKDGNIRIPEFQRGQRWGLGDIAKLFDSIYRGYPIGTLFLWKRKAPKASVKLGQIRVDAEERTDALWIVDGQQRVTALASVLLSSENVMRTNRDLYFDLVNERFVWRHPGGRLETHLPLREAHNLPTVMTWVQSRSLDKTLLNRAFKLADRLRNYQIPVYAVGTEREDDTVPLREIFDRINTFGKRMTRSEVFEALTSSSGDNGGQDLSDLRDRIAAWEFGGVADNTLLLCVLSITGQDVLRDFRSEFVKDSERLSATIESAAKAMRRTVTFLRRDAQVPHFDLVPYQHLLVALVRFFALHPKLTQWERVLLRRWYWRAAVHGPLPKLGPTGTLRLAVNAVGDEDSPFATVERLLQAFPSQRRTASIDRLQWNWADTNTTLCAMAYLGPRVPNSLLADAGEIIDVARLITATKSASLQRIFPKESGDLAGSAANRVFWQSPGEILLEEQQESPVFEEIEGTRSTPKRENIWQAFAMSDRTVLKSHGINERAAHWLQRGDVESFLTERHDTIRKAVDDFVDARAEWSHPVRPAIATL